MYILGIETSCDETAAAVVKDGRQVLSNVVASQVEEHKLYGGVVPEIASRRHSEVISQVVQSALSESGVALSEIDAIAVTYAPGLIGALLVGVNFAKGLAMSAEKPLIPVHHLRGHIASNYISHQELKPPFLCLVVSGGHSHIIQVEDYTKLTVIGKTRDDAAGEAFDKAARCMGMSYPGGVEMDKIAEDGDENAFRFPRPKVDGAPLDFSFSGLKTSVINLMHKASQKNENLPIPDLAASYRKAVVEYLTDHFMLAAKMTSSSKLVVAGGVSANRLLRRNLQVLTEQSGKKLYVPELKYCGDNAAMIASQGYYEFLEGNIASMNLNACAQRDISL
ncbi:tRNA (adenosine(37)-N6)-threonylcarbamoyltransferase complex transferase subunit TsaD [Scatolibacter rhodanostii]|uniref:tRNA (adenosine(37)-N6)-threonylcarbamoyltransferase complex transferase subunit TsaD n=1 Tax=Scatolibacter rhodanostii TaxID=2014781 RepID=UPI000C08814B|nr:tRNA (adenosine(37)-N6)-threonylcarbamoyltransferase complex transferase subunit TsaD [Scatolibacter rhodanostii]